MILELLSSSGGCPTRTRRPESLFLVFSFALPASGVDVAGLTDLAEVLTAHTEVVPVPKWPVELAGLPQLHDPDRILNVPPPAPSSPKWSVELVSLQLGPGSNVNVVVPSALSVALHECPGQEAKGFVTGSLHVLQMSTSTAPPPAEAGATFGRATKVKEPQSWCLNKLHFSARAWIAPPRSISAPTIEASD